MSTPDQTLRETTRKIISSVEKQTGFPVNVERNPELVNLSTVRMARGSMPFHIVYYKPFPGEPPDFAICYQCGFILRAFSIQEAERYNLTKSPQAAEEVLWMVISLGKENAALPNDREVLSNFASQLYNGLILHLYSTPIGMRVGQWVADTYPEYRELQKAQVLREIAIARETLESDVRKRIPSKVYDATQAISAAYALFWSERFMKPELMNPFRQAGYNKKGRELLDIWHDLPDSSEVDRDLIDHWAGALGLTNWYTWIPYQPA